MDQRTPEVSSWVTLALEPNGLVALNGFAALSQYDLDGNGKIDSSDPIWSQLKVWEYHWSADGGDGIDEEVAIAGGDLANLDDSTRLSNPSGVRHSRHSPRLTAHKCDR